MPIRYEQKSAILEGFCTVDEAEALVTWLSEHPKGTLKLKACEHCHTAIAQVIMALNPKIASWPDDVALKTWFQSLLAA